MRKNLLFAGISFALRGVISIAIFGLIARTVGLASFGLLSYLLSLITFVATVSLFGFRMIVVKDVSANPSIVTWPFLVNKVKVVLAIYLLCLVALGAYFMTVADLNIPPLHATAFVSTAIFLALANVQFSFFQAINKFHLETLCLFVFCCVLLIGVRETWITCHMRYFAWSYGIGALLMLLLAIVFLMRYFGKSLKGSWAGWRQEKMKNTLLVALPFAIISIGDISFNTIDILFAEYFLPKEDLGVYTGLMKIAMALVLLSAIGYAALFPKIAALLGQKRPGYLRQIRTLHFALLAAGIFSCIAFLVLGDQVIDLFLGKGFSADSRYDVKMFKWQTAIFGFSRYAVVVPSIFLVAAGREVYRAKILIAVLILTVMLHVVFVPRFGLEATVLVTVAVNVLLAVVYNFHMPFDRCIKTKS